jgi:hypothetical protein
MPVVLDPTFAASMRLYLASLDASHAPAPGEPGACLCGDPQPDGRDRHLLEVITETFAAPELRPHVVHVKGGLVDDEPAAMLDEDGKARRDDRGKAVLMTGRRYVGPTVCPDCRRGLTSRGTDLICPQLSLTSELAGCHDHCIVACGEADRG